MLSQFGLNHGDFPHTVLQSLKTFLPKENDEVDSGANTRGSNWKIPDEEIAKRRDLRKERIFTIDPTSARDLDDALSVTPLADGTVEIGVHIADVTFFVKPNSDLDTEARRRGTTVYLVQRAIPMLPPLLCDELCSLHPDVDRLAFSCIWKMNADGTRVDEPAWFGRTVIRSCCKLDYQTAQRMIDGSILPKNTSSTTPDLWDPNRYSQRIGDVQYRVGRAQRIGASGQACKNSERRDHELPPRPSYGDHLFMFLWVLTCVRGPGDPKNTVVRRSAMTCY